MHGKQNQTTDLSNEDVSEQTWVSSLGSNCGVLSRASITRTASIFAQIPPFNIFTQQYTPKYLKIGLDQALV
jgi:hypothetical protein